MAMADIIPVKTNFSNAPISDRKTRMFIQNATAPIAPPIPPPRGTSACHLADSR